MKTAKYPTNLEIAELLRSVAASYELRSPDTNKFKVIAYERAADAVEHASSELKDLWDDGKLSEIPGIGKSISEHLNELFSKGESAHFRDVMEGLPPAMFTLLKLPNVGPKSAYKLATELNISGKNSLLQLEKLAMKGKIAKLEGFGEDSQKEILKSLEEMKGKIKRYLLPYAESIAKDIISWLEKNKLVKEVDPLGSIRRQSSSVGDIDISVATDNPQEVLEHFVNYPKTQRIIEKGTHTASILLPGSIQVDLMVQSPDSYGALLQHFTGSKHHNIALREYALKKHLSLSEYGIKKGNKMNKFSSEEKFYNFLGMDLIPPELREDSGEIEASINNKLPKLIKLSEIKSDLHLHSDFNIETSHDIGESSMKEIVNKANNLGYEYIALTEHNPSKSHHLPQQVLDLLKGKSEAIDQLNYSIVKSKYNRIKYVFNSLEIDILPDGSLAIDNGALDILDFALVSIHSSFNQSRENNTKRVLSALSHPKAKIFSHPTTRKIGQREGIELDWPEIFDYCCKNNKWIEINADPMRLDLPDVLVKEAIKYGVKLVLGTDSHHKNSMDNMRYGVSVARRGWATVENIINSRDLIEFKKMLK